MINLFPMAGKGNRFFQNHYNVPRPFIPVMGEPMLVTAVRSFPYAERNIFICLKEHYEKYRLENLVKKVGGNSEIILIDKPTEGQACTCLLAED